MSADETSKISRRTFLKAGALVSGAAVAGGLAHRLYEGTIGRDTDMARTRDYLTSIQPAEDPTSLPNIIIILVDDLGYGDLEAATIDTPNLDRMADDGIRLSSFYSSAALCSPSRSGLLTGRYPLRTHITTPIYPHRDGMDLLMHVVGRYAHDVRGIPEDEVLLPEALLRRGYRTGMVGKWHLGDKPGHVPHDRGFESFYGVLYSNSESPYAIYRNNEIEVEPPVDQNHLTRTMTREALAYIDEHQDEPFFLYLAHPMPHEPIHASEEFRGRTEAGLYGDTVEELDWSVGQILDRLQERGLDKKTLVIFTSDNGPWWQGSAGFARGRKMQTFEGGFRVPFLARWPGVIPDGGESAEMSMNFDLFATCLQIAGVPLPADRVIDGRDMMPMLSQGAPSPHETLFFYDTKKLKAVRHGNWKYHRRSTTDNAGYWPLRHGPFLFNLDLDPNESYSLIESYPDVAARLVALLDDWDAKMKVNTRGWLPE